MKPIPETQTVFEHLDATNPSGLPEALLEVADRVAEIVPECVGLSLSVIDEGLTMTLLATDATAARLDASQYFDDGPCIAAVDRAEPLEVSIDDLLDEGRWLTYARLSAASGVASSLSLPVTVEGEVVGGLNIYASTPTAFEGRQQAVAAAVGTPAEWAVTNADLGFSSRLRAVESAARLGTRRDVDLALGIIAERHRLSIPEARERLRRAAAQAGISEAEAARAIGDLTT